MGNPYCSRHTGILQLTVQPESKDAFDIAQELRDEFVISATGTVKERQDDLARLLRPPRQ